MQFVRTLSTLLAGLGGIGLVSPALAGDDTPRKPVAGGTDLLVGPATNFQEFGNPSALRFTLRGNVTVINTRLVMIGLALPLSLVSSGEDQLGFQWDRAIFEMAPAARLRVGNVWPVRPYVDVGYGFWLTGGSVETVFGELVDPRAGSLFDTGLGVEIGAAKPGALTVILEPGRFRYYGRRNAGDEAQLSMNVGIGARW